MNYGQLKLRASRLAKLDGWDHAQPQTDWAVNVNRALYLFSWHAEYLYASYSFVTVAGQAEYPLPNPSDWIRVTDVAYNGAQSLDLTDENILRGDNKLWHLAPNSSPTRFFITSPNVLRLYPPPATAGIAVALRGLRADTALVLDTDTPGCPEPFHEGIVLLAAWLHAKTFVRTPEDVAIVASYYKEAMLHAAECQSYLGKQASPVIQRYVRREPAERLTLGWYRTP